MAVKWQIEEGGRLDQQLRTHNINPDQMEPSDGYGPPLAYFVRGAPQQAGEWTWCTSSVRKILLIFIDIHFIDMKWES
jgi:hypothetical protein